VRVTRFEEFVLADTDHRKAHLREAFKAMERREEIVDISGRNGVSPSSLVTVLPSTVRVHWM